MGSPGHVLKEMSRVSGANQWVERCFAIIVHEKPSLFSCLLLICSTNIDTPLCCNRSPLVISEHALATYEPFIWNITLFKASALIFSPCKFSHQTTVIEGLLEFMLFPVSCLQGCTARCTGCHVSSADNIFEDSADVGRGMWLVCWFLQCG